MKNLRAMSTYQESPRSRMGAGAQPNVRTVPAVNPDETFFHFDILRALEMHRGLALGIFLTAFALSCAYVVRRWHTYKAESIVYVQPSPPKLLQNGQNQQWPFDANTYESYIQQQIHNVTRSDVLANAVQRIPDFQGAKESLQAAADRLGGNLKVDRVSTGYQISIEATGGSATDAALMANAVSDSFIQSATRELRSGDSQRLDLLREERDRVEKELAGDRAEQDALNKQLGVASVGATPDFYDDQIAAIRAELVKARTDNDEAAAKLMATAGGGPSSASLDAAADEIVAADPGLVSMKTALNKRRSDLISQMSNLKPDHPLYKQDAEELAKIQNSLDAMTKDLRAKASAQIEQKLKSELERTSSVESRLNGQLAQMTRAAGSATPRLQRANDLATDISRLQARFTAVDEEFRNLSLEVASPGAVYLAAPAVPPLHADRRKVYRNALIVLLAGIVFALAAALIALNLDPRIYIAADVERVLGFAPMALLPDLYEVGTGVAEEYLLRLAAAVEHAHQQGNLNSCIFTGAAPGAGATTVSNRVTSMLQAMGRETVLVDAVGAPPEEPANPGSELVHVPRGSRSTALLQQMTAGARDEAVVVTDAAPLLVSGETEYLARFVDSAIIVIESGVTTKSQLREVARTLERLDVAAVGFVLNRISLANANPAFRQSVHAVEKHLKAQTRSFERQPAHPAPAPEIPVMEKRERYSPMYERLQSAVSEPSHLVEPSLGRPRARDTREKDPVRDDPPNDPKAVARPDAPITEQSRAAVSSQIPNGAAKKLEDDAHIHNSAVAETATMWQSENSTPTGAAPAWHADNSQPAYAAPAWPVNGSSPFAVPPANPAEISAPAVEQKPTAAESSSEEVHMEKLRPDQTLNSPWWENAAAPATETASAPVEVTAATILRENEASQTPDTEVPSSALRSEPLDDRELPSYLRRPQETPTEFRYEDFLKKSMEGITPWEESFARLQKETGLPDYLRSPLAEFETIETEVEPTEAAPQLSVDYSQIDSSQVASQPLSFTPGNAPIVPVDTAASSEYPAMPANYPAEPAENAAEPTVPSQETSENQMEGWKFGPSNSDRPTRGRDGVQVILPSRPSAPLTGEDVPDVWRDLLRAEEEAAAYAAQQAQTWWPPAPTQTEDLDALRRLADEFNLPKPSTESVYTPPLPMGAPSSFESQPEQSEFPHPPLEAQQPAQPVAETSDFAYTPVEALQPFEFQSQPAEFTHPPLEAQHPVPQGLPESSYTPVEPEPAFEPHAEAVNLAPPQPEAQQPLSTFADTAEPMYTPAEPAPAFEPQAQAPEFTPLPSEVHYTAPEPAESHDREQLASEPAAQPELPAWTLTNEFASLGMNNSLAELYESAPKPEPLKEWWEELAAHATPAESHQPSATPASVFPAPGAPPATEAASKTSAPAGEQDEGLNRAASRLSGLRNLLVTLGIQNLHQGTEQRNAEAMQEPQYERPPERPIYAQPAGPNGTSAEVTTAPQIIPPKFNPLTAVREKEPKTPAKPAPVNRWDSPDDVDILPARRGQYRQRY